MNSDKQIIISLKFDGKICLFENEFLEFDRSPIMNEFICDKVMDSGTFHSKCTKFD